MCGCGGHSAVQPHSMGGVSRGRGGTHTGTHTGTYTRMLHPPFSDLPLKKCPIRGTAEGPARVDRVRAACLQNETAPKSFNFKTKNGPKNDPKLPRKILSLVLLCRISHRHYSKIFHREFPHKIKYFFSRRESAGMATLRPRSLNASDWRLAIWPI